MPPHLPSNKKNRPSAANTETVEMHKNTRSLNKAPLRPFMIPYRGRGCQIRKEIFTVATYTKRGSSYRIRASVGYTPEGKQVM